MKNIEQVKKAVERFKKTYKGSKYKLTQAMDRYFMRNQLSKEAFKYLNNELGKIEKQ